ncbi:MAG: glycosyltransferase [Bacteroidaceae bacterium]|nr:glycosyltransferase [Bacteroidaceae bacterium]
MQIVHIIFTFNTGGTENLLVDIANEQIKQHSVKVVIIDDCYEDSLLQRFSSSVDLRLLNRKPGSWSPWPFVKLNAWLLRWRPDVVHIHNAVTPRVLLRGFNLFYTAHALGVPATYFKRLRGIIAISDSVKSDILSRASYCRVTTVPNGINTDKIASRPPGEAHKPFRIVQVARLVKEIKGQDLLIEAVARLTEEAHDVSVDFIGAGDSLSDLQALVEKFGLTNRVSFLGSLGRDEIYARLAEYDLMCHPSRNEGFGLTIAEAMAAHLPVLVADADGPYEIIEHGKYGTSFKKNDVKSLHDRLQQVMADYDYYANIIADRAYEHVLDSYSISNLISQYDRVYLNRN